MIQTKTQVIFIPPNLSSLTDIKMDVMPKMKYDEFNLGENDSFHILLLSDTDSLFLHAAFLPYSTH